MTGAPAVRILLGSASSIGPGKARLLEAIAEHGSISAAARSMEMSYRRAWLLINSLNQHCVQPLVVSSAGGQKGGGAQLTPFGAEVLNRYRQMEKKAEACLQEDLEEFARFLGKVDS